MILTYTVYYNGPWTRQLLNWCLVSCNLYNQTCYYIKQQLETTHTLPSRFDLIASMQQVPNLEGTFNYKLLKAQCALQCVMQAHTAWVTYFKALKDYKCNPSKYHSVPKPPRYKKRGSYNTVFFTNQDSKLKDTVLTLSRDIKITLPNYDRLLQDTKYCGTRVEPVSDSKVKLQVMYEVPNVQRLESTKYAAIDLGVDNVISMVVDEERPVLFSGKQLKTLNQRTSKLVSQYKSEAEKKNGRKTTKRIQRIYKNRNNKVKDICRKITATTVKILKQHGIGHLTVGYNRGWKDNIRIGTRNNQVFVSIPYYCIVNQLKYKCALEGIQFETVTEEYTSKCDALSCEPVGKKDVYEGIRVKRGMYLSSTGKLINADINGALNILRSRHCSVNVVDDSEYSRIINSGRLYRPVKYKNIFDLK